MRWTRRSIGPNAARLARARRITAFFLFGGSLHCTEEIRVGQNFSNAGAPSSAGGSGGAGGLLEPGAGAPGAVPDAGPAACTPAPCGAMGQLACGNCDDDDADGRIDSADPECLGPCDASESVLVSGLSTGTTGSCRADCYFDRNAGSGNDGCRWSMSCDPLSVDPSFFPTGSRMCEFEPMSPECELSAEEASACQAGCLPLTPNGCDCFGCCEFPGGSGHFVWLGSESLAAGDCDPSIATGLPDSCPPCTFADICKNECDECELCVGKPELPPSCNTGGSVVLPSCPDERRPCDPARGLDCGPLAYCITGCCAPLPT